MAFKMKGSPYKQNIQKQQEQYKEEENPLYRPDRKWWEGKRTLRKSEHGWKPAPWASDVIPKGRPTKMKSPLQQGSEFCPECGMEFETMPQVMAHMAEHLGGPTTGGGTPGYDYEGNTKWEVPDPPPPPPRERVDKRSPN